MKSNVEYKMTAQALCDYVSICNLRDKRRGIADLVDIDQINRWGLSLRGRIDYTTMYHINPFSDFPHIFSPLLSDFSKFLSYEGDIIIRLLEVTCGKMSLCGGAILHHMIQQGGGHPNDYDFFFHCDDIEQADNMLKLCMEIIEEHYEKEPHMKHTRYSRSQYVQTVTLYNGLKLQFIRRNYQHISQILLGFDLPCCQYGYNLVDGFFATIPGALAYATYMYPLDLTQRSLSFGFRIEKYLQKGFKVLLPGLNKLDARLETPDGILQLSNFIHEARGYGDFREVRERYSVSFQLHNNQEIYSNPDFNGDRPLTSDYEGNRRLNWYYLAIGKDYNVTFYSNDWKELYNLSEDKIRDSIFRRTGLDKIINVNDISLTTGTLFLGEQLLEFYSLISNRKYKEALNLWNLRIERFKDRAFAIYREINSLENAWRYKNPGGQDFGKFNPILTNPREWYGPDYKPVIVGIDNDRFSAFANVCRNTGLSIPLEIFKILCYYWLVAEATDAKNKLFHIGAEISKENIARRIYEPGAYDQNGIIPGLPGLTGVPMWPTLPPHHPFNLPPVQQYLQASTLINSTLQWQPGLPICPIPSNPKQQHLPNNIPFPKSNNNYESVYQLPSVTFPSITNDKAVIKSPSSHLPPSPIIDVNLKPNNTHFQPINTSHKQQLPTISKEQLESLGALPQNNKPLELVRPSLLPSNTSSKLSSISNAKPLGLVMPNLQSSTISNNKSMGLIMPNLQPSTANSKLHQVSAVNNVNNNVNNNVQILPSNQQPSVNNIIPKVSTIIPRNDDNSKLLPRITNLNNK